MKFAIVGVGKVGLSLLEGMILRGGVSASEIGLFDIDTMRLEAICERFGATALKANELPEMSRVVIAVQPQTFAEVSEWVAQENTGYVSPMAGITLSSLSRRLGTRRVVRVMPNLGSSIGYSQTALVATKEAADAGDQAFATQLFQSVGDVYEMPEHLFDAFTGMSASSIGYIAAFAEALAEGGVAAGLPHALAQELAAKNLVAGGLLLQQRLHPAILKNEVSSPGGSAMAGLEVLEEKGIRSGVMKAVMAAARRSAVLGEELERD